MKPTIDNLTGPFGIAESEDGTLRSAWLRKCGTQAQQATEVRQYGYTHLVTIERKSDGVSS